MMRLDWSPNSHQDWRPWAHTIWAITTLLACLAGLTASAVAQQRAEPPAQKAFNILFVGNSHLIGHNVPERVRKRLVGRLPGGLHPAVRRIGFNGAKLSNFVGRQSIEMVLASRNWDVVVLQEATASFLLANWRRDFHESIRWFLEQIPQTTDVILFQTWPWQNRHRLFNGGFPAFQPRPDNSAAFWDLIRAEYDRIEASQLPVIISPVGACWLASPRRETFYSRDGNHATRAGANFTADILARSIRRVATGADPVICKPD